MTCLSLPQVDPHSLAPQVSARQPASELGSCSPACPARGLPLLVHALVFKPLHPILLYRLLATSSRHSRMTSSISTKARWSIQCPTALSSDTFPSLIVTAANDGTRYLFSACPENLVRACTQDRIPLRRLKGVFLSSSVDLQTTSGLGGESLSGCANIIHNACCWGRKLITSAFARRQVYCCPWVRGRAQSSKSKDRKEQIIY